MQLDPILVELDLANVRSFLKFFRVKSVSHFFLPFNFQFSSQTKVKVIDFSCNNRFWENGNIFLFVLLFRSITWGLIHFLQVFERHFSGNRSIKDKPNIVGLGTTRSSIFGRDQSSSWVVMTKSMMSKIHSVEI